MAVEFAFAAIDINDPADYAGGPKGGRVLSFGSIERALSDPIGREYEVASATLTLADDDRQIRNTIDQNITRNSVIDYFIYSDANRRAEGAPLRLFQGVVRGDEELDPLTVRLTIEDRFGSQFSQFDLGKLVPGGIISPEYFQNAPAEVYGRSEPLAYGRLSDEPIISATGAPVIDIPTLIGGFLVGSEWTAGYGSVISDAAVPSGTNLVASGAGTVSDDVPASTYGLMVTAIDAYGRESDPFPFYATSGGGISPGWHGSVPTASVSGSDALVATWSASAGAVKYRAYLGFNYYGWQPVQYIETTGLTATFTNSPALVPGFSLDPSAITPGAVFAAFSRLAYYTVSAVMPDGETVQTTPSVVAIVEGQVRPSRIEWLPVVGAISYYVYRAGPGNPSPITRNGVRFSVPGSQTWFEDNGSNIGASALPPPPQGVVQPIYVGQFTLSDASEWSGFLVCRGCATYIQSWYIAELDDDEVMTRIKQSEATEGPDFLIPGRTNWNAIVGPNKYIDIGDRRYTIIFARGEKAELAITGEAPLTLNILGYEPVGDGNGDGSPQVYIDDLPRQYLHFLTNFVVQETGFLWKEIPLNADGYSIINGESFEAAKEYYDSVLSGGLKGAWMLGVEGQEQVSDVIAQLNKNVDGDIFTNQNGQIQLDVCDTEKAIVATITDVEDVLENSFRSSPNPAHFFNEVVYRYAKVYIEAITKPTPAETDLLPRELADRTEWFSGIVSMYDPVSIPLHGELQSYDIDFTMIRDQRSAEFIVKRWLVSYTYGARYAQLDMNLCGTDFELGQMIALRHYAGVGLTGWVDQKLRILRSIVDLDDLKVSFEFRVINFTYTTITT